MNRNPKLSSGYSFPYCLLMRHFVLHCTTNLQNISLEIVSFIKIQIYGRSSGYYIPFLFFFLKFVSFITMNIILVTSGNSTVLKTQAII